MSERTIARATGKQVSAQPTMPVGRHAHTSRRPPLRRTFAEAMALFSPARMPPVDALLAAAPRGDGHAVLVLPGLFCGDGYTAVVREHLSTLGYAAHGWDLGTNIGPTRRLLQGAMDRL